MEGDYYLLENKSLQKIDSTKPKTQFSGFNLQVIGNELPDSFSTDEDTTKTVFIAKFKEGK